MHPKKTTPQSTHHSATHLVHSRIDFFLMTVTTDRYRVKECSIGTADLSDHNVIYLTIHLNDSRRNTRKRLNISILNKESAVKEIKERIKDNMTDQVDQTIIWDTVKTVMRGQVISRTAYLKKLKRAKYDEQQENLRKLEKQQPKDQDRGIVKSDKTPNSRQHQMNPAYYRTD